MSPYKSFEMLNAINEQSYYVKALYYAYGQNDLIRAINNPAFSASMMVDASKFAECYANHIATGNGHIINVADCLNMFRAGQTEFKR